MEFGKTPRFEEVPFHVCISIQGGVLKWRAEWSVNAIHTAIPSLLYLASSQCTDNPHVCKFETKVAERPLTVRLLINLSLTEVTQKSCISCINTVAGVELNASLSYINNPVQNLQFHKFETEGSRNARWR
jgi:hypothetical protein